MENIIEHEERGIFFCLLHSQAVTGSLCKGNQIPFHEGINVPEPTLGNKLVRFFVYARIRVHEICGHADWYLHSQPWLQICVKIIYISQN